MTGSPEYRSWDAMVQRVTNPLNPSRRNYFDKGVDMDPRWLSFSEFFKDMGRRPPNTTLERRNGSEGYWPSNCVWATRDEQNSNTSRNRFVDVFGERMTLSQACRKFGLSTSSLYKKRADGAGPETVLREYIDKLPITC